jgi:ribosomal protein S10
MDGRFAGREITRNIPLPTRIEKFTVNRLPHVDKESREQFEMRTHKHGTMEEIKRVAAT